MNILDCPEEIIIYIFVPSNIDEIFDNNTWLFTCKKLYNFNNKIINKAYIKNDIAGCKVIDILLKLRFSKIDYINKNTYRELFLLNMFSKNNIYFNDKIISTYITSIIRSLSKHIVEVFWTKIFRIHQYASFKTHIEWIR